MTDAPVAGPIAKKKGAAAADADAGGGKKRFEVKKVYESLSFVLSSVSC